MRRSSWLRRSPKTVPGREDVHGHAAGHERGAPQRGQDVLRRHAVDRLAPGSGPREEGGRDVDLVRERVRARQRDVGQPVVLGAAVLLGQQVAAAASDAGELAGGAASGARRRVVREVPPQDLRLLGHQAAVVGDAPPRGDAALQQHVFQPGGRAEVDAVPHLALAAQRRGVLSPVVLDAAERLRRDVDEGEGVAAAAGQPVVLRDRDGVLDEVVGPDVPVVPGVEVDVGAPEVPEVHRHVVEQLVLDAAGELPVGLLEPPAVGPVGVEVVGDDPLARGPRRVVGGRQQLAVGRRVEGVALRQAVARDAHGRIEAVAVVPGAGLPDVPGDRIDVAGQGDGVAVAEARGGRLDGRAPVAREVVHDAQPRLEVLPARDLPPLEEDGPRPDGMRRGARGANGDRGSGRRSSRSAARR